MHHGESNSVMVQKTCALRASLVELLRTPTDLVLTSKRIDVAKLSYHLRLNGDRIGSSELDLSIAICEMGRRPFWEVT